MPGGDEDSALAGVDLLRAEVRCKLSPHELLHPAPADLGPLPPVGQLAIEEDREAQVVADQRRGRERLGAGRAVLRLVQVDDGRDVDGADVRVVARVRGEVYAFDRLARPVDQRNRERA